MTDVVQIFRENLHLLADVRPLEPRENLPRFVGEARYVADFAERAKKQLVRVGVPLALIETLERRVCVLEGAQVELHVSRVRKEPRELALTREAMAMRREVTKIASFAGRRRPEILRQVRSLVALVGLDRTLSDLRLLADLAFHEQALFASVGEDGHAWSERLLTTAHALEREIVERRLARVEQRGRVDLRNRAYAWVLEALREIKAATRFLGVSRFADAERAEELFLSETRPEPRRELAARTTTRGARRKAVRALRGGRSGQDSESAPTYRSTIVPSSTTRSGGSSKYVVAERALRERNPKNPSASEPMLPASEATTLSRPRK
jgi:hypothetical protein